MKDAYYFSHDSNAKDDPKCMMLIETLQLEGYGIFWMLVETLRDQPDYKYPLMLIPALARRYNTTPDKIKAVVHNYGLFQIDDKEFFYSESLNTRMISWDNSKEKFRLAGVASGKARRLKALEQRSNDVGTSVELLDKIREDKNKIYKEVYGECENVKLTDKEYKKCIEKHGEKTTLEGIDKLSNYKASKGKKYKSDYGALNTWVWKSLKEEVKITQSNDMVIVESTNQGINDLIGRTYEQ